MEVATVWPDGQATEAKKDWQMSHLLIRMSLIKLSFLGFSIASLSRKDVMYDIQMSRVDTFVAPPHRN